MMRKRSAISAADPLQDMLTLCSFGESTVLYSVLKSWEGEAYPLSLFQEKRYDRDYYNPD